MILIKLVSFDVWDTLLKLDVMLDAIAKGISRVAGLNEEEVSVKIYGVRERIKEIRRKGELSISEILSLSRILIAEELDIDEEIVRRGVARAILDMDYDDLVNEYAKDILGTLKKKGLKIIVIGNVMIWESPYTRLLLEATGLAEYIDKQYYADEMGVYKPMKEAFYNPLKDFETRPDEAIHIGDSNIEDFEGALESGLYAIKIDPEANEVSRSRERGYIAPSLKHALRIIMDLLEGSK